LQRNQHGTDLLIPFFISREEDMEFGAILVQVKNRLSHSDVKDVGRKLFVSSVFKHWKKEEQNIPVFLVVLELGLSRAHKNHQPIPNPEKVDLVSR
jgi:hypothetical protein